MKVLVRLDNDQNQAKLKLIHILFRLIMQITLSMVLVISRDETIIDIDFIIYIYMFYVVYVHHIHIYSARYLTWALEKTKFSHLFAHCF